MVDRILRSCDPDYRRIPPSREQGEPLAPDGNTDVDADLPPALGMLPAHLHDHLSLPREHTPYHTPVLTP